MSQKLDSIAIRPAREFSSLNIGNGSVRHLSITSRQDLSLLHQLHLAGEHIHVSGRGTNSVFGSYSGIIVSIDTSGYEWLDPTTLKVEAGEGWQVAVDQSIAQNLCGIERLTLIPGTAGAAPVQNIGAFGQILSERLLSLEVYDYAQDKVLTIRKEDCGFGEHRASNFKKHPDWASYIILSITIKLLDSSHYTPPSGDGLMKYAEQSSLPTGNVVEAEQLIRAFRSTLYPDYRVTPNCGSYFTNLEIDLAKAKELPESIWGVKHREARNGKAVLFQCKDLLRSVGITEGYTFSGGLMMHPEFNNFLINTGNATTKDLLSCHQTVNDALQTAYGITLVPEPEFVDDSIDR